MVLKWGFQTHFTCQNNIPSIAHYGPLGIFEKWGCARCFPSTVGHLKYLNSSNNSLNAPFVFRLGRNGFGRRWCTPAAATAATRVSANAPIKHFLNEGLWACLLRRHAWQECWNILMSSGSLTLDSIFHRGPGSDDLNLPLVPLLQHLKVFYFKCSEATACSFSYCLLDSYCREKPL